MGESILGTPQLDPNVRRGPQKCPDGRRRGTITPKCALVWGKSILGTPKMDPNVRRGP